MPAQSQSIVVSTSGVSRKNTRTMKNTPAATIVAAWMSAETGVGPAIASVSHTCSGNCADLPRKPHISSSPTATDLSPPAASSAAKSVVP